MLGFYDVDNIIVDISTTKVQLFLEFTSPHLLFYSKKGDETALTGPVQD